MQRVNPSLDSRSSRKHYCLFCNSNVDDEFNLGVFFVSKYRRRWTAAHHHCLLFAAGLKQAGKDSDGFAGFLLPDVMDEYRRCRRLRCAYCKKNGAASGCVMRSCRQVFHYTCGMTGGSLFQFYGSFQSFCCKHRPKPLLANVQRPLVNTTCPICMEETDTSLVSHNVLLSPCCGKGYFHRLCIQQQAYAAGYHHLRCSLCNNSDKFVKEMLRHGINVPNQDAIWEIEGLFDDLYERYARCDVENCCCVMGRNHQESQGPWRIIRCNVCGQAGRHFYCLEDKSNHQQWECEVCSGMKSTETDVATSRLEWRSSESNQSDPLIDKLLPNLGQTSIIDLSSPEPDRGKPLSGTMEIYNEDNKNQSRVPSLESCKTGYSSPGDQTSFKDSGDQTRQRSFWLSFSVVERQQEYLLSPYENKDETTTLTDLGLDDSVSFVRAISATPTANPRKSKPCQRLDVHDVDSELSDTDLEPPVYRFTFEQ